MTHSRSYRRALLFCCVGCVLTACSSAPDEVSEVKDKAAEYASFGNTYFSKGQYDQALTFFTLALEANVSVDYGVGVAQSYYSIGKVYLAVGDFTGAEKAYESAHTVSESLSSDALAFHYYNNMGELGLALHSASRPTDQSALDEAERMLMEALKLSEALAADQTAVLFHNLGLLHKKLGDHERSLEYLNRALEVNLKGKRQAEVGANYYMISSVYSKQSDYTKAYESALKALEYDKKAENSLGIAKDLIALGIVRQKQHEYLEAHEYFKKAYAICQILALSAETRRLLNYLVSTADAVGNENDRVYYQGLLDKENQ